MIGYSHALSCRSKWISLYFGDCGAADCGVCDNCIRHKKVLLTEEELRHISSIIMQQVSHHELHIDTLLDRLSAIKKEKAWQVLQFLQAEKKLEVSKEGQLKVL
jgi:ATP-dependent DNA helicase RecQ